MKPTLKWRLGGFCMFVLGASLVAVSLYRAHTVSWWTLGSHDACPDDSTTFCGSVGSVGVIALGVQLVLAGADYMWVQFADMEVES